MWEQYCSGGPYSFWQGVRRLLELTQIGAGLQIRVPIWFFFLISQPKHMLWNGSFEHPKHMFKLMGKEIYAILDG